MSDPCFRPPLWFFDPQTRNMNLNDYCINVFVHVVRSSSGSGYNKELVSQNVIRNLNEYYKDAYISFRLVGDEYIDSDYFNRIPGNDCEQLFNTNGHTDALDVYVLSSGLGLSLSSNDGYAAGIARAIPSTACILNGSYYNLSSLPHEVGHCLGLYHTHHGTCWRESSGCSELVDGSNSSTCGDYIEDTPADPCLWSIFNPATIERALLRVFKRLL